MKKGIQQEADKDLSKTYHQFKDLMERYNTGMKIGRSHKWYYDKDEWKETKLIAKLWSISYVVTIPRARRAP